MLMKRFGTLLLLLGMSTLSSAQVDASEILLMRAHMLRLKPVPDMEYPSEPGHVSLSAPVRVSLSPPEFLIGKFRPVPELVLKMGGMVATGNYRAAMQSSSTFAPNASPFAPKALRAGYGGVNAAL